MHSCNSFEQSCDSYEQYTTSFSLQLASLIKTCMVSYSYLKSSSTAANNIHSSWLASHSDVAISITQNCHCKNLRSHHFQRLCKANSSYIATVRHGVF